MTILLKKDIIDIGLVLAIVIGIGFIAIQLFGMLTLAVATGVLLCLLILVIKRWKQIRNRGFISYCSPKFKALLLERSIMDIFRDVVYFPYITRIIGAFLKIAASKPHPNEISQVFNELPKNIIEAANAKGVLSIAPSALQHLMLPQGGRQLLPNYYGRVDEKWDHQQIYDKSADKVHEQTIEKRVVHFLDGKLGWPTAAGLAFITVVGATHMHPRRFKKMLMQNLTFCCMLLSALALLVKLRKAIKHKKQNIPKLEDIPALVNDKQN